MYHCCLHGQLCSDEGVPPRFQNFGRIILDLDFDNVIQWNSFPYGARVGPYTNAKSILVSTFQLPIVKCRQHYSLNKPFNCICRKEVNVISLRSRYQNLYIPSDFFNAQFSWTDAFPVHQPFELGHSCSFHVFNKEVVAVEKSDAILEPSDADHLYSAKVCLSKIVPGVTLTAIYFCAFFITPRCLALI